MLPGKVYKPEDFLWIAWRRRWHILVPFVVITTLVAVFAWRLPDRYQSQTMILIVPQRVPENYVRSTVTARIQDRLRSINEEIQSRTRLEPIIRSFGLYPGLMKAGLVEDAVNRMRNDIDVQVVKGDSFQVSYTAGDPTVAMRVTEQLARLFIDENLRDREVLADDTSAFLESQLADAKARLVDHEKKLEAYNRRYAGELPTQMQSNLQVLQNAQMQIQALVDGLGRDKDRRLMLEGQLNDALADASASNADPATPGEPARQLSPAAQQLAAATTELHTLEGKLTPQHPDIIRLKRTIADLRAKVDAEALAQAALSPQAPGAGAVVPAANSSRSQHVTQLKTELASITEQINTKEDELKRLQGRVAEYQGRVEAVPTRESELVELTRDYDTLQKTYTNLLQKKEEAQVAANLERRQIGEQFKVLDPARRPERPISPNRQRIDFVGAAAGLGLGLALAALLEYRDRSMRSEEDVMMALALPVVASIPTIITGVERKRVRRNRLIASGVAAAAVVMTAAVVFWSLRS